MTWKIPALAALIAAVVLLPGLGRAPFVDPSEGFHAQVAREMATRGDWLTPHVNGVRYFDKPPLLYWSMAAGFAAVGLSEAAARLGAAVPAVALAAVTAWLGVRLASPRTGLLAGLVVVANLGVFLFGRLVKPDLLFILLMTVAQAAFLHVYLGGGRRWLLLFWGGLGLAVLAKDVLGAVGPLVALALWAVVAGEGSRWRRWSPRAGLVLLAAVALPWYLLVEVGNRGFLWYTVVDNHLLNFSRQRVFPDEDVPLGALEFLAVTGAAFLPWTLAVPLAVWRRLRDGRGDARSRAWLYLVVWAGLVVGFFTLSPFKLPHYGLPAFPALALLVARTWDEALSGGAKAPSARWLGALSSAVLGVLAAGFLAAWLGSMGGADRLLASADVGTRNLVARGEAAPGLPFDDLRPLLGATAVALGAGAVVSAVALACGRRAWAVGALTAATLGFLLVGGRGFVLYADGRSVRPLAETVARNLGPGDVLAHEGALENSGSWLLRLDRQVHVVNGLRSNLAFGATLPEGREVFWDEARLRAAWDGPSRVFLLSTVEPARSAAGRLPPERTHLLGAGGGRWLYSNRP